MTDTTHAPQLSRPIDVNRETGLAWFASTANNLARFAHQRGLTTANTRDIALVEAWDMQNDRPHLLQQLRTRGDAQLAEWLEANALPEDIDDIPF